jgi:hypothetical protein
MKLLAPEPRSIGFVLAPSRGRPWLFFSEVPGILVFFRGALTIMPSGEETPTSLLVNPVSRQLAWSLALPRSRAFLARRHKTGRAPLNQGAGMDGIPRSPSPGGFRASRASLQTEPNWFGEKRDQIRVCVISPACDIIRFTGDPPPLMTLMRVPGAFRSGPLEGRDSGWEGNPATRRENEANSRRPCPNILAEALAANGGVAARRVP